MAKLSYVTGSLAFVSLKFLSRVVERKRRQVYRGEVHGQLPFDPKGMDDAVPSVDFSPSGSRDTDSPYSLERADISSALRILTLQRMSDSSGMIQIFYEFSKTWSDMLGHSKTTTLH